jgi:hypothetical protein
VAEVEELNKLFEMQHKRTNEATARWARMSGRDGRLPDLGRLVEWLLRSHVPGAPSARDQLAHQ